MRSEKYVELLQKLEKFDNEKNYNLMGTEVFTASATGAIEDSEGYYFGVKAIAHGALPQFVNVNIQRHAMKAQANKDKIDRMFSNKNEGTTMDIFLRLSNTYLLTFLLAGINYVKEDDELRKFTNELKPLLKVVNDYLKAKSKVDVNVFNLLGAVLVENFKTIHNNLNTSGKGSMESSKEMRQMMKETVSYLNDYCKGLGGFLMSIGGGPNVINKTVKAKIKEVYNIL